MKFQYREATQYKLSNHLGNVLLTITNRKIQTCGADEVSYYTAQIVTTSDYYPFGMQINNRSETFKAVDYRFGFNGVETDNEVKGKGNSYNFGARILDSRLGRWLSLDPLSKDFPSLSPYHVCSNNPVLYVDPDGRIIRIHYQEKDPKTKKLVDKYYDYTPGVVPTVNNTFVNEVHEAINYVIINDDSKTFQGIASDKNIVHIKYSDSKDPQVANHAQISDATYDKETGEIQTIESTITWNSKVGMLVGTGAVAPSTILLHEAGHSKNHIGLKNISEFATRKESLTDNPFFRDYDNTEEQRVIAYIEEPYIKNVNLMEKRNSQRADRFDTPQIQKIRKDHRGGSFYVTEGVNSIKSNDPKVESVDGESRPDPIKSQQDQLKNEPDLIPKQNTK